MDGYRNLESYVMVDSFDRDQINFPDSAVFAFHLDKEYQRCTNIDLVQAAVPNIIYNVTVENNHFFLKHHEYDLDFFISVRIPPGHYDVFTFVDELQRLLNDELSSMYKNANIDVEYVFRLVSTGDYVVASQIEEDGSIKVLDDDGTLIASYQESEIVRLDTLGRYQVLFLEKKGRMQIKFSLTNSQSHFTLILAPPSNEEEKQFYIKHRITPSLLRKIPYQFMGFKPDRNYSNIHTKFPGYDPSLIGLSSDDIDTNDLQFRDMILSTKYMQIYNEPYIYMHILELVMPAEDVPTSWGEDGNAFKRLHTDDITDPQYNKVLFNPLGKIMINTFPGQVVYYNEKEYPNRFSIRDFIPPGIAKNLQKITIVWTKKDGTILNFNKIDLTCILKITQTSIPFDEGGDKL